MKIEHLTRVERLLLSNQFRILETLEPDKANNYAKTATIFENGYTSLYDDVTQHMDPEEMSLADGEYVFEVLDLFRTLQWCFGQLKDKEGLGPDDVFFFGFDQRDERRYWNFVTFLREYNIWEAEPLNVTGDLNSHHETISRYRVMLKRWMLIPGGDCPELR